MNLLCLDLDGTLVDNAIVEVDGKLQRRQHELFTQPVLLENRLSVLRSAAQDGWEFAIVTNQGGVAWGYHTVAEVYERIGCALRQLAFFGGRPLSVHVCFSHPRATVKDFKVGTQRRKPSGAMIREAIDAHLAAGVSSAGSLIRMVGDRDEDREAAKDANVEFVHAGDFFGA